MKAFQIKLKVEHFQMHDLFTFCFDYESEILHTRYREPVKYIGTLDLLKVAYIRLRWNFRKTKAEVVVFGIKFYIKDVYSNKFNIKNSKYALEFTLLDILGIKNERQLMKRNMRIIVNWVLKLKIKMSGCW